MTSQLYKAKLLDSYYQLRAESALPDSVTHFQFGKFRMGHGFLTTDGEGNPIVDNIPSNTTVIPNVFHTGDPVIAYANGRTSASCVMPAGTIPIDTTQAFSVVGIYDKAGDTLIAILAGLEINLTSIDDLTISSYIDNVLNQ